MDGLAEVFILLVVRIITLCAVGAEFMHEFLLDAAVLLYLFVCELDCLEHVVLADFLEFAFHHHDVFLSSGNHEVDVGLCHFREVGVDAPLSVDTGYAHL